MSSERPLVSVGVPVYQGENFLAETLDALRTQDYPNTEIIISDNASTDRTAEIIAEHSARDPRIRTLVQESNIGAAENYNEVFRAASGEFFAWNAHDDLTTSGFLSEAVAALQADPAAVLAVAKPFRVDAADAKLHEIHVPSDLESPRPDVRFRAAARASPAGLVFGVFRTETLAATRLHGHFSGSDRNLMAETMLYGHLVRAYGSEFHLREHESRSVRRFLDSRGRKFNLARDAWYAPERGDKMVFPHWRRVGHYIGSVTRAPLGLRDSARCYWAIVRLFFDDGFKLTKQMAYDIVAAGAFLTRKRRSRDGNTAL